MKKFALKICGLFFVLGLFVSLSPVGVTNSLAQTPAQTLERSQTPIGPFPYQQIEVLLPGDEKAPVLTGELTLPMGDGPFPAVVLLTVAGPNDRDQSFLGHRGYFVLADHLTRNGISVLRLDDRGVGGSGGDLFQSSYDDLAEDAVRAVNYVSSHPKIDREKIGIIGMSEGGAIGSIAALKSDDISFLVMLSAPGIKGQEAMELQLDLAVQVMGFSEAQIEQILGYWGQLLSILNSDQTIEKKEEKLVEFFKGPGKIVFPPYPFVPQDAEGLASFALSPWFLSQLNFDPAPFLAGLKIPVLAVAGDNDKVLPPERHLKSIEKILNRSGSPDVTIVVVPGLNHIMQISKTGLPTEYGTLDETISPRLLELLSGWIKQRN